MVIDFGKNADHAIGFAVFDSKTRERLDDKLPIVFADDEAGILRLHVKPYRREPDGSLAVIEEQRQIDIVRKA